MRKNTMINLGRYLVDEELSVRFTPSIIDRILEGVAIVIDIAAFVVACYAVYSLPEKPILVWLSPFVIPNRPWRKLHWQVANFRRNPSALHIAG